MSSWANRNLPRRRDLAQIPDALRPTIVPRSMQPLVLESESLLPKPEWPMGAYAMKQAMAESKQRRHSSSQDNGLPSSSHGFPMNQIIYPGRLGGPSTAVSTTHSTTSVYLPSIQPPSTTAKELQTETGDSIVFVILRHLRNQRDNELWIQSYNSIRKWYTNPIKIIDDHSSVNTVNGRLVNAEVIYSEFNGAGEILPYYYFVQHKWASRMIFLHDSMFLHRPFQPRDIQLERGARFHWYFDGNGYDNDIKVQTYVSVLKGAEGLAAYLSVPHHEWRGCFGGATMMDLTVAEQLEEKYGLFRKLVIMIRTRPDREAFERFLGKVLFFEGIVDAASCALIGDILLYPNAFEGVPDLSAEKASQRVAQRGYDTPIVKIWRGR